MSDTINSSNSTSMSDWYLGFGGFDNKTTKDPNEENNGKVANLLYCVLQAKAYSNFINSFLTSIENDIRNDITNEAFPTPDVVTNATVVQTGADFKPLKFATDSKDGFIKAVNNMSSLAETIKNILDKVRQV